MGRKIKALAPVSSVLFFGLMLFSACGGQNYHFTKDQGKNTGADSQATTAEATTTEKTTGNEKTTENKPAFKEVPLSQKPKKIEKPIILEARSLHEGSQRLSDDLTTSAFDPKSITPEDDDVAYIHNNRGWELPYGGFKRVTGKRDRFEIKVRGINEFATNPSKSGSEPTEAKQVRDEQVLIPFDIPKEYANLKITDIKSLFLDITLYKKAHDRHKNTELLCIVPLQICSGVFFTEPGWKNAINKSYKDASLNQDFSNQMKSASKDVRGTNDYEILETPFRIDLLKTFGKRSPNTSASSKDSVSIEQWIKLLQDPDRVLYFVAADDLTVIGRPQIHGMIEFEQEVKAE